MQGEIRDADPVSRMRAFRWLFAGGLYWNLEALGLHIAYLCTLWIVSSLDTLSLDFGSQISNGSFFSIRKLDMARHLDLRGIKN